MYLWRYLFFFIYGIEGVFEEFGVKIVIFGRVVGKFLIRLVFYMNMFVVEI